MKPLDYFLKASYIIVGICCNVFAEKVVVSAYKLAESGNFLSVNLTITNTSQDTLKNIFCGWKIAKIPDGDLIQELDWSDISNVETSKFMQGDTAVLGYNLSKYALPPNHPAHLNIRIHRSDWKDFNYKNGSYLGLANDLDVKNPYIQLKWDGDTSVAAITAPPISASKSISYEIQSRLMQISENTAGIEFQIKNTGASPLSQLQAIWTPSYCTSIPLLTADIDWTSAPALTVNVVPETNGIQSINFNFGNSIIASGEEKIVQFRVHSKDWTPVDFNDGKCFEKVKLANAANQTKVIIKNEVPDSNAVIFIVKSDPAGDSILINYDFSNWKGFSSRKSVPLSLSSTAVTGAPTVKIINPESLPTPQFDSSTWTGQIFDIHTAILNGKEIEVAIPLPDTLSGITSRRSVEVLHYTDGAWKHEKITRIANGAVYFLVRSLSGCALAINNSQKNDPQFDPSDNWDWTDVDWYSRYSNFKLRDPFTAGNSIGLDLSFDPCLPEDGWMLYIRRLFDDDSRTLSADPITGLPSLNDPHLYRKDQINISPSPIQRMPYFVLYNVKTGIFRNFLYMSDAMNPTQAAQTANVLVSIGNASGMPATETNKVGNPSIDISSSITHGVFANAGGDDNSTYQPLSNISSGNVPYSIIASQSQPYSFVNGDWIVFDVESFYDPYLASKMNLDFPVYYCLRTSLQHSMRVDLNGTLSGTINQNQSINQAITKPNSGLGFIGKTKAFVSTVMDAGSLVKDEYDKADKKFNTYSTSVTKASTIAASFKDDLDSYASKRFLEPTVAYNGNPPSYPATFYGIDFLTSTANVLINNSAALSSFFGLSGAAYSIISSGIFSESKSITPVLINFDLNASIQMKGAIDEVSSPFKGVSVLSGSPKIISGINADDGQMNIPYYAKKSNNAAIGAISISRPPKIALLAAHPKSSATPFWWVISEDLRNIIRINPSSGLTIAGIYYDFYTNEGFKSKIIDNDNQFARTCLPSAGFCTYASANNNKLLLEENDRINNYINYSVWGDAFHSETSYRLDYSRDCRNFACEYYDYNLETSTIYSPGCTEREGECVCKDGDATQCSAVSYIFNDYGTRKNSPLRGWDVIAKSPYVRLHINAVSADGKVVTFKLNKMIPEMQIFDPATAETFNDVLIESQKSGAWLPFMPTFTYP